MNVLLVDADSHNGFPNLALMKLSAWYKQQGHSIDLIQGIPSTAPLNTYDKVLISCIFQQNREKILDYVSQLDNVQIGGSGFDYNIVLDHDIEHILPDYSLYDLDYSMGFTSRGCIRNCEFCIVPEKEGFIRNNAPIHEFLHPDHMKVILLDNNFQASPECQKNLDFIIEQNLKVNFNQGLDIRLMTPEFAEQLAYSKYYNWTFKTRSLYFAFDSPKHEKAVRKGIQILETAGIPPQHLMFYVLVGFDTSFNQDMKRVEIIKELGCVPYIMRYNQVRSKEINDLARWVNRRYYQFIPWGSYNGVP